MFCSNCGKEIADKAVVCVHCGCAANGGLAQKSMLCAIILWLFLGGIGAHRYYLGHNGSATVMLLCLLFSWLIIPGIVLCIWWLIDLFSLLSGSLKPKDGSNLI